MVSDSSALSLSHYQAKITHAPQNAIALGCHEISFLVEAPAVREVCRDVLVQEFGRVLALGYKGQNNPVCEDGTLPSEATSPGRTSPAPEPFVFHCSW